MNWLETAGQGYGTQCALRGGMQTQSTAGRTRDALRLRVHAGGRKPSTATASQDSPDATDSARTEIRMHEKAVELEPHIAAAIDLATD